MSSLNFAKARASETASGSDAINMEISMRFVAYLVIIGALNACSAISNEGKVDFRRTDTNHSMRTNSNLQEFKIKNLSLGKEATFRKGDSLSLHLRSAYIKDFSEDIVAPYYEKAFSRQWGKINGEIAIIANAFEGNNGKELSFEDMREGRVVFYSDDVHERQILNFDNMPIYGPIIYDGSPFIFRISIFELDVVSEQAKAMLNTVAQAGATAYPPASPVLELLNGIGSTFFSGDQTDTEFRYTMALDPNGGVDTINHLRLESGNYVLVRVEDRDEENVPWDELVLDENLGEIYWKNKVDAKGRPLSYQENTYLIVEINKNISDVSVELAENNFGSLMSVLQARDKEEAKNLQLIEGDFLKVAIERVQIRNFSKAKTALAILNKGDKEVTGIEKWHQAKELLEMIGESVDASGSPLKIDASKDGNNVTLSGSQVRYVMEGIRRLIENKISPTDWSLFDLKNIFASFIGTRDAANGEINMDIEKQNNILRLLIAPENEDTAKSS